MRKDKKQSGQESDAKVLIAEDTESGVLKAIREKFITAVNKLNAAPNSDRGQLERRGVESVIKEGNLRPFKVTDRRLPELRAQFKKNPEAIFFEAKENSELYYLHFQSKNGEIQSGIINPTNLGSSMVTVREQQLKKVDLEKLSGLQKFVLRISEGWRDFKERWNIGTEQKWEPEIIPLQEDLVKKTLISAPPRVRKPTEPAADFGASKQRENRSTQPTDQGKDQRDSGHPTQKNR